MFFLADGALEDLRSVDDSAPLAQHLKHPATGTHLIALPHSDIRLIADEGVARSWAGAGPGTRLYTLICDEPGMSRRACRKGSGRATDLSRRVGPCA
ncbi:hypothetical protein GCM10027300_37460 [Modestobacter lapidis]